MPKDLVPILPDYDEKIGNMSARILAARDAEMAGYAHFMATMLAESDAQREENKRLAEIRKKRHGIDPTIQQPSTLAILARPKDKDLEHFLRPLPDNAQIKDKDGNIDVAERKVTIEEVSRVEAIRRRPKNSTGQSEISGASEESKTAATNAFVCSPGIKFEDLNKEEKQRVSQVVPYEQPKPLPTPTKQVKKTTFWDFMPGSTRISNLLFKLRNK